MAERREFVSGDHERRVINANKRARRREKEAETARRDALRIKHATPPPSAVPDLPAPHPAGPVISPIFGVKPPRDTTWDDLVELGYGPTDDTSKEKRVSCGQR